MSDVEFVETLESKFSEVGNRSDSFNFISQFQGKIPVYSSLTNLLYFDYEFKSSNDKIQVLLSKEDKLVDGVSKDLFKYDNLFLAPGGAFDRGYLGTVFVYPSPTGERRVIYEPAFIGFSNLIASYSEKFSSIIPVIKQESLQPFIDGESFVIEVIGLPFNFKGKFDGLNDLKSRQMIDLITDVQKNLGKYLP